MSITIKHVTNMVKFGQFANVLLSGCESKDPLHDDQITNTLSFVRRNERIFVVCFTSILYSTFNICICGVCIVYTIQYTVYRYSILLLPILYDRKTRKNDDESGFLTFDVILHFYCFIHSWMVWSHVCLWNELRNKLNLLWPTHIVRNQNITT